MTALKLVRDSYVDDNLSGGSEEEVAQMRGTLEKLPNGKLKYNGEQRDQQQTPGSGL